MTSYGDPEKWVLASDDIPKWPEQFAAYPPGTTFIVPSGDDRYYAIEVDERHLYITWAEAKYTGSPWAERLKDRVFDYAASCGGPHPRARWPGRYPPPII